MNDDLREVATWADALLVKLSGAERCRLLHRVAIDLRRSQAQRIASQQAPDGSGYVPRKHRKNLRGKQGRVKRQKSEMFNKLRTTKFLKIQNDEHQLTVGFVGRVARIARVHQEGLEDRVAPHGPQHQYPERILLGLNAADQTLIRETLLNYLTTGQASN